MIAVIQRVKRASVLIDGAPFSEIGEGLLVLLGVSTGDGEEDAQWLSTKICQMRLFADPEGKMNLSLPDINGELLVVSQFTLLASTKKGNRPSFTGAARPEKAIPLYEYFLARCAAELHKPVLTGRFGADMRIDLSNDGPVTIILDSQNKH